MKGRAIDWQPEELAWIEARKDQPRRDLHAAFCARFNRPEITLEAFKNLCKRKGWLTGRTGCFPKGQVPMNKGQRMPYNPNSAATRFQKGQRPANKFQVGHESLCRDGYVTICVDQPNPWTGAATRMIHKHRWLWEQAHGPVPQGMRLKCLDGNRQNTDPSNWEAVPMGLAPRLNGRSGRGYDSAEPELKPVIMAIAKLEHAARTARQKAKT